MGADREDSLGHQPHPRGCNQPLDRRGHTHRQGGTDRNHAQPQGRRMARHRGATDRARRPDAIQHHHRRRALQVQERRGVHLCGRQNEQLCHPRRQESRVGAVCPHPYQREHHAMGERLSEP